MPSSRESSRPQASNQHLLHWQVSSLQVVPPGKHARTHTHTHTSTILHLLPYPQEYSTLSNFQITFKRNFLDIILICFFKELFQVHCKIEWYRELPRALQFVRLAANTISAALICFLALWSFYEKGYCPSQNQKCIFLYILPNILNFTFHI